MKGVKQLARQLLERLRKQGRSREDAEDLIQEAFLRLHVYCKTEEVLHEEAFLARTVHNLAVDLHRKEHRDLYVEEPVEALSLIGLRPSPDEEVAAQQRLTRVMATLDALAARTRDIFYMHRLEGYACSQIAEHFGISVSAVEKHIARAVLALMDEVDRR